MKSIDMIASKPHYLDHLVPIWDNLPDEARGTFYVPQSIIEYASKSIRHKLYLFEYIRNVADIPHNDNPILVASYGDLSYVHKINPSREIIYQEHGIGHTFHTAPYPDGKGKRDFVSLFVPPNEYTKMKILSVRPEARCEVIGTPKLDPLIERFNRGKGLKTFHEDPPIVAIGFHWGIPSNKPPESGSAFEYYKKIVPKLRNGHDFELVGFGHPLDPRQEFFEQHRIPFITQFEEVMEAADICINDLSSAMYEFVAVGKPVIVLNAPWFRPSVHHGIRFWDYSDIGPHCESPDELLYLIHRVLDEYETVCATERMKMIHDLYPYLGEAIQRAVQVLVEGPLA